MSAESHALAEKSTVLFRRVFGADRNVVLTDVVAGVEEANNNTIVETLYLMDGKYEFAESLVIHRKFDIIGLVRPFDPKAAEPVPILFAGEDEDVEPLVPPVEQPGDGGPIDAPVFHAVPPAPLQLDEDDGLDDAAEGDDAPHLLDDAIDVAIFADAVGAEDEEAISHFPRLDYSGSGPMFVFEIPDSNAPDLYTSFSAWCVPECSPYRPCFLSRSPHSDDTPIEMSFLRLYGSDCRPNPLIQAKFGTKLYLYGMYIEADSTGPVIHAEDSVISLGRSSVVHYGHSGPAVFKRCYVNVGSSAFSSHFETQALRKFDVEFYHSVATVAANGFVPMKLRSALGWKLMKARTPRFADGVQVPVKIRDSLVQLNANDFEFPNCLDPEGVRHVIAAMSARIDEAHAVLRGALCLVDLTLDAHDEVDPTEIREALFSAVPLLIEILFKHRLHRTIVSIVLSVCNTIAFHAGALKTLLFLGNLRLAPVSEGVRALESKENFAVLLKILDLYADDAKIVETMFATLSCIAVDSSASRALSAEFHC